MLRFHESEQVLVHRVGQEVFEAPPCGVVTKVYQLGESFIYNYDVKFADRTVRVKDDWLAPNDSMIKEVPEFRDLLTS